MACAAIGVEQTDHGTLRWFSIGETAAELEFSVEIVECTFNLMSLDWDRPKATKQKERRQDTEHGLRDQMKLMMRWVSTPGQTPVQ